MATRAWIDLRNLSKHIHRSGDLRKPMRNATAIKHWAVSPSSKCHEHPQSHLESREYVKDFDGGRLRFVPSLGLYAVRTPSSVARIRRGRLRQRSIHHPARPVVPRLESTVGILASTQAIAGGYLQLSGVALEHVCAARAAQDSGPEPS